MGHEKGGLAEPKRSVAVIGSGLAGLTAAFLFHRDPRYNVTLYEASSSISLDAASVIIKNAQRGDEERVDVPMRSFAAGYYENLIRMFNFLGITYHNQPFVFSFARPKAASGTDTETYFVHSSNHHRFPPPRPRTAPLLTYALEVLFILLAYAYWNVAVFVVPSRPNETLDAYLRRIRAPQAFTERYLLPLMASVATCSHEAMLAFPSTDVTNYKRRSHGAAHLAVRRGVAGVSARLSQEVRTVFSACVTDVSSLPNGQVQVTWKDPRDKNQATSPATVQVFDHVILAVPPPVVASIYEPLRSVLAKVPFTLVDTCVARDDCLATRLSLEVTSNTDISPSQLITLHTSDGHTIATHATSAGVLVQTKVADTTESCFERIDTASKIKTSRFLRVLRTVESRELVNNLLNCSEYGEADSQKEGSGPEWRNGDQNVWLTGSWCWDGMVLLEGCVVSAMRVAQRLGVEVPWDD